MSSMLQKEEVLGLPNIPIGGLFHILGDKVLHGLELGLVGEKGVRGGGGEWKTRHRLTISVSSR